MRRSVSAGSDERNWGEAFARLIKEVKTMKKSKRVSECQHPKKLKEKSGECNPEQIRDCHGAVEKHPCAKER